MRSRRMPKPKGLVLLSGGLDSMACLHFSLNQGHDVQALFVDYGQVACEREERAASAVAKELKVPLRKLQIVKAVGKGSGLIQGRNAFLILCALMETAQEPGVIAIGIHQGTPYWDCSEEFVAAMQSVLDGYAGGRAQLLTPFLKWTKREIFEYSKQHQLPVRLTYSCERGAEQPCGRCSSCQDLEALNAGK